MPRPRRLQRGIYLMPTLFTVSNLFCGVSSLLLAAKGEFRTAAALIVFAAVLDGLDGRIARLTGTTSEFGLEFDSMADVASFGIAPAVLVYYWALEPTGRFGWLVAFLYVVCAATRLARFNIGAAATVLDKRWFAGLPSPMAGLVGASVVFAFPEPAPATWLQVTVGLAMLAVGGLMVSRFRYRSFKEIDLRDRRSYVWVLPVAAVLVLIAVQPEATLLALTVAYLLSGPGGYLWGLARRRPAAATGVAVESNADEPVLR